jgi:hypothetical protein
VNIASRRPRDCRARFFHETSDFVIEDEDALIIVVEYAPTHFLLLVGIESGDFLFDGNSGSAGTLTILDQRSRLTGNLAPST